MRNNQAEGDKAPNRETRTLIDRIRKSADYLASRMKIVPKIGMITGTGLGEITEKMEVDIRLPYERIPNFPSSTTAGHRGTLVCGNLGGKPIIAMEGRFHNYEGDTPQEIAFPIRVMSMLGIDMLLISSAAGGLNPHFEPGDLMIVTDHINLTGMNPLIGPNLDPFGPRFPDMSRVYDRDLMALARERALELGILIREGTYVGVVGPSLETPSETRFLRMIGADAVGMSTVQEVIAGVHCGLRVMVIAAITNVNLPDCMDGTSIDEIIVHARNAGVSLARLWERILNSLAL